VGALSLAYLGVLAVGLVLRNRRALWPPPLEVYTIRRCGLSGRAVRCGSKADVRGAALMLAGLGTGLNLAGGGTARRAGEAPPRRPLRRALTSARVCCGACWRWPRCVYLSSRRRAYPAWAHETIRNGRRRIVRSPKGCATAVLRSPSCPSVRVSDALDRPAPPRGSRFPCPNCQAEPDLRRRPRLLHCAYCGAMREVPRADPVHRTSARCRGSAGRRHPPPTSPRLYGRRTLRRVRRQVLTAATSWPLPAGLRRDERIAIELAALARPLVPDQVLPFASISGPPRRPSRAGWAGCGCAPATCGSSGALAPARDLLPFFAQRRGGLAVDGAVRPSLFRR